MPYLAYDLDAFSNAEMIGRSCGLAVEKITHGSLLMWRHVWLTKSDIITTAHIRAFFGGDACEALVLFGQLEASEVGWRVRGAAKWLRVQTAQSDAGKAHSGNLKRGQSRPGAVENPPAGPRLVPGSPSGSPPALSSSIQHPPSIKPPPPLATTPPLSVVVVNDQEPDMAEPLWAFIGEARTAQGIAVELEQPRGLLDWITARKREGRTEREIGTAYGLFIRDPTFEAKGWPTALFLSPKIWTPRMRGPTPAREMRL